MLMGSFPDLIASHFADVLWPNESHQIFNITDYLQNLPKISQKSVLFAPQLVLLCVTCAFVLCVTICCLLQPPTTMTEVQKCQCHGC